MRQFVDIAVSAVAMVIPSTLLVVLGIVVVVTRLAGGYFRPTLVGPNRRLFRLLKCQSMAVPAGSEAGSFDASDASRVTMIGRDPRKSKLDERPQLWNVLVGDLSLGGPRPGVPVWTVVHQGRCDVALSVRLGITRCIG